MIRVDVWNTRRPREDGQLTGCRALLLGGLDAPFDVTNRVEILGELPAIGRTEAALQPGDVFHQRIENAAVFLPSDAARRRVGARRIAEQPLEDRPRLDLDRQRRRRGSPRERVAVCAAVTRVAGAEEVIRIATELERGE